MERLSKKKKERTHGQGQQLGDCSGEGVVEVEESIKEEYMVMGKNKINNMKYGQGRSQIT